LPVAAGIPPAPKPGVSPGGGFRGRLARSGRQNAALYGRRDACRHRTMERERSPRTLGLFEKRIDGDDALLELARLRFEQSGLGAEMQAATTDQLQQLMKFQPGAGSAAVVHLPRDFNLLEGWCRQRIVEFASIFSRRIDGLVLHDRADLESRMRDYRQAAEALDSALRHVVQSPAVYVEYAAGLPPAVFVEFFERIRDLPHVSACIDIGHVGIRQARVAYAALHRGQDICAVKEQKAKLPEAITDMEKAVRTALPVVLELITQLGVLGKPVHFHLHDGHPLSTLSPFGVSDHLSFFEEMALGFEYQGRRFLPLMFGPSGLGRIAARALETIGPTRVSFTLEIHPTTGQLALGDAAGLFHHWRDKTNAERMNQWLSVLVQNHDLLRKSLRESLRGAGEVNRQ